MTQRGPPCSREQGRKSRIATCNICVGHATQACHPVSRHPVAASGDGLLHGAATRIAILLGLLHASSELSILASSSHIAPLTAQCNIYLPLDCSIDHVICDKVSCLDSLAAAASAAEKVMLCSDQPLRLPAWLFMPPAAHRQQGF